jgi:hypothetical protein
MFCDAISQRTGVGLGTVMAYSTTHQAPSLSSLRGAPCFNLGNIYPYPVVSRPPTGTRQSAPVGPAMHAACTYVGQRPDMLRRLYPHKGLCSPRVYWTAYQRAHHLSAPIPLCSLRFRFTLDAQRQHSSNEQTPLCPYILQRRLSDILPAQHQHHTSAASSCKLHTHYLTLSQELSYTTRPRGKIPHRPAQIEWHYITSRYGTHYN